jgi:hypothetical protein
MPVPVKFLPVHYVVDGVIIEVIGREKTREKKKAANKNNALGNDDS